MASNTEFRDTQELLKTTRVHRKVVFPLHIKTLNKKQSLLLASKPAEQKLPLVKQRAALSHNNSQVGELLQANRKQSVIKMGNNMRKPLKVCNMNLRKYVKSLDHCFSKLNDKIHSLNKVIKACDKPKRRVKFAECIILHDC
eukprot:TRINITY_DN9164_c0_g1_i4.p1 TRINITY_DN9164_c0_g1~~TRINITY_DN9164_c0_g1_i4.p1  ORF type:complete len:142 (+),score=24.87 TRINITY_DN9164_c0_g1_i4:134-559(+)